MKVAFRGMMYNANDIANGKAICYDLDRQGIPVTKETDPVDMSFRVLVPDSVPLTSDEYP